MELDLNELEDIITLEKECNSFSYTETTKSEGTKKVRTKKVNNETKESIVKEWTKTEERKFEKYLLSFDTNRPTKGGKITEYQNSFIHYLFTINDEEHFAKLIDSYIPVSNTRMIMIAEPLLVIALSVQTDIIASEIKNDLAIVDDEIAKMKLKYLDKLNDACPALNTNIANNNIFMYLIPFYTRLLLLLHSTDNVELTKKYFGRNGYDMVSFTGIFKNACDYLGMNHKDLVDDLFILVDNIYEHNELLKYLVYCSYILSISDDRLKALSEKIKLNNTTSKLIDELRKSEASSIVYNDTIDNMNFSLLFNVDYQLETGLKQFNPDLVYSHLCDTIEQMIFATSNDLQDNVSFETYVKLWKLYINVCNYLNVQYGYRREISNMMYSIYQQKYTKEEIVELLYELTQSVDTEKDKQYLFNILTGYKSTSKPITSNTIFGYSYKDIILELAADDRLSMYKIGYDLYDFSSTR